jgi:hypothetical protein
MTGSGPERLSNARVSWGWAAVAATLLLVVGLDVARAAWGTALRPWQWAAGLALVAAGAALRRARGPAGGSCLPELALALLLLPALVDHSREVVSDGIHYYSYLRSTLFDGDLDLRNDYELLGWDDVNAINVLPVGAPILWSPLVVLVHAGARAASALGADPPTGAGPAYQAAVCLATFLYGSAGLLLLQDTLRRFASPAAAFWATVLCWVGSPLRFYLSAVPSLAHGVEFFAAVLVLRGALNLRERPDVRRGLLAGAACGLVLLTRSQDGLLLSVPVLLVAPRLLTAGQRPAALRALAATAIGFALAALPQIAVWQAMFGVPLLIPHKALHGEAFLHLDQPQLLGMLISPRGGVFTSYPILLLGFLGLLTMSRRRPLYVAAALPALLSTWYLNASVFDWYHVRRFTGVVPLVAPGLALLLPTWSRGATLAMALLAFLTLRYDLGVDRLRSVQGDPAPVRAVVAEIPDGLARDGYALLEPLAPRAAVTLLGAYTGEPLLEDVVSRIEMSRSPAALVLPARAGFWSGVEWEDGRLCRWVNGRTSTSLFLPLAWSGEVVVTVDARPLETPRPQEIEVLWNGTSLGAQEMAGGWGSYRFHAPPDAVRAGTNELTLRFEQAPVYHRVRGAGPRQIRPAAVSRISLHRGTP